MTLLELERLGVLIPWLEGQMMELVPQKMMLVLKLFELLQLMHSCFRQWHWRRAVAGV